MRAFEMTTRAIADDSLFRGVNGSGGGSGTITSPLSLTPITAYPTGLPASNIQLYDTAQSLGSIGNQRLGLNAQGILFANFINGASIQQDALASTSGANGAGGFSLLMQPQTGQAVTDSHAGGQGGTLLLAGGTGGNSTSGAAGAGGDLFMFGGAVGTGTGTPNPGRAILGVSATGLAHLLQMGGAGQGLALPPAGAGPGTIALTTGTTTLTAAQATPANIDFGTSSLTGACTVIFPATQQGSVWFVDATDVTFNSHAITLEINGNAMSTTISAAALWMVFFTHQGKFYAIPLATT
jgi:hypothetical protein